MNITDHKTESIYRRYAIVSKAGFSEGMKKFAALMQEIGDGAPKEFRQSLGTKPRS